jgi:hypothetical protein
MFDLKSGKDIPVYLTSIPAQDCIVSDWVDISNVQIGVRQ